MIVPLVVAMFTMFIAWSFGWCLTKSNVVIPAIVVSNSVLVYDVA